MPAQASRGRSRRGPARCAPRPQRRRTCRQPASCSCASTPSTMADRYADTASCSVPSRS